MGYLQKIGESWIEIHDSQDVVEWIVGFVILFSLLFIIGTPVYFGLFALWQMEYTWKSYFIFNGLFSLFGYIYVKLKSD